MKAIFNNNGMFLFSTNSDSQDVVSEYLNKNNISESSVQVFDTDLSAEDLLFSKPDGSGGLTVNTELRDWFLQNNVALSEEQQDAMDAVNSVGYDNVSTLVQGHVDSIEEIIYSPVVEKLYKTLNGETRTSKLKFGATSSYRLTATSEGVSDGDELFKIQDQSGLVILEANNLTNATSDVSLNQGDILTVTYINADPQNAAEHTTLLIEDLG